MERKIEREHILLGDGVRIIVPSCQLELWHHELAACVGSLLMVRRYAVKPPEQIGADGTTLLLRKQAEASVTPIGK